MPEKHHPHHSQRRSSPFVLFLETYWVEILIVVGLLLSVFSLFEQMNIRATSLGWFSAVIGAGLNAAKRLFEDLIGFQTRLGFVGTDRHSNADWHGDPLDLRIRWRL